MKNSIIYAMVLIISFQAQAVYLSDNQAGQVLLFPYYTVNAGYNTLINLVNTTDQAKALRVRFKEAANGRTVYALNLYLGANDVWTAALFKGSEDQDFLTGLISNDVSCSLPSLSSGVVFFNKDKIGGNFADPYGNDTKRLHEGFIEVIEMGVLTGDSALAGRIDQQTGVANCQILADAWDASSANSYWLTDADTDMLPPTGGIMGNVILIDVQDGLSVSAASVAINDFSNKILHADVDSESPNLTDSNSTSTIFDNGSVTQLNWENGIQALSSILTVDRISNEYALDVVIDARTEWLINFPTKSFFTDPLFIGNEDPRPPFTTSMFHNRLNGEGCEPYVVAELYDREENIPVKPPGTIIPGTSPPPPEPEVPTLCFSSNDLSINKDANNPNFPVGIFASNFPSATTNAAGNFVVRQVVTPFENGWLTIGFQQSITTIDQMFSLTGLPVIGFAVQRYTNSSAQPGILAQYAGMFEHKRRMKIERLQNSEPPVMGMSLADNNIGQTLIYPYYSVRNGINTLLSVVNTTDKVKALRVILYEGQNSRAVLNFNLYLSPFDEWTAALIPSMSTASTVGANFADQSSGLLLTFDTSCTVPVIGNHEFLPFAFSGSYDDGLIQDMSRVTEGHIEIFEMGELIGEDAVAATHFAGVPSNCPSLLNHWLPPAGKWLDDPTINVVAADGVGGLYGSVSLIDVASGVDMTYDATAIVQFSNEINHNTPGIISPNLASASGATTLIETDSGYVQTTWASPINAVTALFMQSEVDNDFVIDPVIGAQTEWVNLFPTKRFYVDPMFSNSETALAPFSQSLEELRGACEKHLFTAHNREQLDNRRFHDNIPYDPPPPEFIIRPLDCWSVNVSEVRQAGLSSNIFASNLPLEDQDNNGFYTSIKDMRFTSGWMRMDFVYDNVVQGKLVGTGANGETHEIAGMPVLGFVAQKFVNDSINNGSLLANYAIINKNKGKRSLRIETNRSNE
jgi:hypothetical protein